MNKNHLNSVFFFSSALLLFLLDIFSFFLIGHQFIFFVLLLYVLTVMKSCDKAKKVFLIGLLILESFLFYNHLALPLVYLLPISFILIKAQDSFLLQGWYFYLPVLICIIFQIYLIEGFLLGFHPELWYTMSKICANIVLLWCLSLKIYKQDKRDNRLQA